MAGSAGRYTIFLFASIKKDVCRSIRQAVEQEAFPSEVDIFSRLVRKCRTSSSKSPKSGGKHAKNPKSGQEAASGSRAGVKGKVIKAKATKVLKRPAKDHQK